MSEKKIHIVVVDDEVELANILCEALELEDFAVSEFHSAVDALEKLDSLDFQVIISDANMPKMTGLEFLEKAKEKISKNFLFYLCTGDMDINKEDFIKLGGTQIVLKPFNIFDLCDEINKAVVDL